jgi:hypothetical protein
MIATAAPVVTTSAIVTAVVVVVVVDVYIDVAVHVHVLVYVDVSVAVVVVIDIGLRATAIVTAATTTLIASTTTAALGVERRSRQQDRDDEEGEKYTGSLHVSPLLFLGGFGFDLCDGDAVSIGRRIEGEGVVAEGGRKVPGEYLAMLRLCVIGKGSDDELARQWKLSELDPDLPIETFLTEGVLLAGDTVDGAGTDVVCCLDLLDGGIVSAPFEEVD